MNSNQKEHIYCILFSDLKGYSDLRIDRLKNQIVNEMAEMLPQVAHRDAQLIKTMGDGLMIGSYTPYPLAETALKLRDWFRTTDWKGLGFPQDFLIRIGLHLGQVILHLHDDNSVKDAIGTEVDTSARIEPVTAPNAVFCSKQFYDFLATKNMGRITGTSQGKKPLAKQFGEMELYELHWHHEQAHSVSPQTAPKSAIPMPTIKQEFTDKDHRDYLRSSFQTIKHYFDEAVQALQSVNSTIEIELLEISSTKFTCEIFRSGRSVSRCKIWLGGFAGGRDEQINYVEGNFGVQNDNKLSASAIVQKHNNQLKLLPGFSGVVFGLPPIDETKSMPEQLAEYFWLRATQPLSN